MGYTAHDRCAILLSFLLDTFPSQRSYTRLFSESCRQLLCQSLPCASSAFKLMNSEGRGLFTYRFVQYGCNQLVQTCILATSVAPFLLTWYIFFHAMPCNGNVRSYEQDASAGKWGLIFATASLFSDLCRSPG